MRIGDLMTPQPLTIRADAPVSEALSVLYRHDIRRLPVIENGDLVGILTDRDIKQWMGRPFSSRLRSEEEELELPVSRLMTRNPMTVAEDDGIREAVELMVEHKISGLPVLNRERKLVGVVSELDILRYTLDLMDQIQKTSRR